MLYGSRRSGRPFFIAFCVLAASLTAQTPSTTTISEVRWSDSGWGPDNDRNLVGSFSTQTFTVPCLGTVQSYFLRQYDASSPTRYSRYSAALHLNYPL
jgi:hypothetical protein